MSFPNMEIMFFLKDHYENIKAYYKTLDVFL